MINIYNYNNRNNNYNYQNQTYPSRASTDYGANPFVVDIKKATQHNNTFRTALWTGNHLQLTLMSIPVGEDIGLEVHPNVDQFLRIEAGHGLVQMGNSKDYLSFQQPAYDDFAIFIPAGTWHNVTKTDPRINPCGEKTDISVVFAFILFVDRIKTAHRQYAYIDGNKLAEHISKESFS